MGKKLAVVGSDNLYHLGAKGYLTVDGVHKSVKKMYLTQGGVHRLVFGGGIDIATMVIGYSAADGMQDAGVVTMGDGKQYRLLTLTKSGTLTVPEEVQAEVWMCGGGANGSNGSSYGMAGYGGAGAFTATGALTLGASTVAVIAAGDRGASSIGSIQTATIGTTICNGGTGGGGNLEGTHGKGDGVDKHPFGDTTYFPDAHCAGGGGGGQNSPSIGVSLTGGAGGTNGGNGSPAKSANGDGGAGGEKGGGKGGRASVGPDSAGGDATFYGSGGGGGACLEFMGTVQGANGGAGYQGVIYVRIPVNQ